MKTRRIITLAEFQMTPKIGEYLPLREESFQYSGDVAEAISFLYAPPQVIPGTLTRPDAPNDAVTQIFGAAAFTRYGMPAKVSANTVIPITANADAIYGFLLRPYPAQGFDTSDQAVLYAGKPPIAGPASVLRKGYIGVLCQSGVPALGAQVYVRYQNAAGNAIVGGVEAGTTGNNYAATGWFFSGPADANGNVEIYSA